MATIQVRDVPERAYERLRARARARHESIQRYMLREVVRLADEPTDEDLWDAVDELALRVERPIAVDEVLRELDADRR